MMKRFYTRRHVKIALGAVAVAYIAFPALFFASSHLRRFLIFGAYIRWPFHDYEKPDTYGFPHAKNFYVNSVGEIKLGSWYIPAKSSWHRFEGQSRSRTPQKWMLDDDRPIIIYYHGHANCRACDYRIGLYKVLSQDEAIDAHVFAFDYRGFSDSTSVLPERQGVLHDSTVMFDYVRKLVNNNDSRILVWGHSLGTAVAVQLSESLSALQRKPMGIVLEAPFNSLVEAALAWPLALPYRYVPGMSHVMNKLRENDETFYESEQLAAEIKFPVLLLHSSDDMLVPYPLGQKLLKQLRLMSSAPVEFYDVNVQYSAGHRFIYLDPGMAKAVGDFIKKYSGPADRVVSKDAENETDQTTPKQEL